MPAAKKSTVKRKPAKRAAAKPAAKKNTTAKKAPAKRAVAKKATVKKAPAKRAVAKKAPAKKAPAKRAAPAKKAAAPMRKPSNAIIKKKLTKTQILKEISERTDELSQKQVSLVFESLHELVQGSLKKGGCGEFAIPNVGVKIRRVKKKATKARWGRNPATGEQVWIQAKPARQVIKVTALKALKETSV